MEEPRAREHSSRPIPKNNRPPPNKTEVNSNNCGTENKKREEIKRLPKQSCHFFLGLIFPDFSRFSRPIFSFVLPFFVISVGCRSIFFVDVLIGRRK